MPDDVPRNLRDLVADWSGTAPENMPASLDEQRAKHADDGLAHCTDCGGIWFTATAAFQPDGTPRQVLAPLTCVGCGARWQHAWPRGH